METLVQYHTRMPGVGPRVYTAFTRQVIRQVLGETGQPDEAEVSVLFLDDAEMQEMNRQYRDVNATTDVLAFAAEEGEALPLPEGEEAALILGDVVICIDAVRRQAAERGHSWRRELAVLLVHGALHLLGYDHREDQPDTAEEMQGLEARCLERLEKKLII